MKGNKRILIIAVVLGLISILALNSYIRSLDKPALTAISHTDVVVAANTIPAHTRITGEMLEVVSLPSDAVHPEAARSLDAVAGGISRTELIKGEQVLLKRVFTEERRASLSYRVPEGMRAIAIPVGDVAGVAGYISPGDTVDVLISYEDANINEMLTTYTVFQNIKVLAAGGETRERDTEAQGVVSTVTLAVTPAQAEVLAFAYLKGTFHLTLRFPLDEESVELESYSFENFDTYGGR